MPLSAEFIHALIYVKNKRFIRYKYLIGCLEIVESPSRAYDAVYPSKNTEQENKPSAPFRQVSVISEEQDDLTPPLHRSNYALDFRNSNDENISSYSQQQMLNIQETFFKSINKNKKSRPFFFI